MDNLNSLKIGNALLLKIRNERDHLNWLNTFEKYAKKIIVSPESFNSLTKLQRLAVSITIIGSGKVEFYNLAFRILCEWEYLGGFHWIIQEEILRHICLNMVSTTLDSMFPYKKKFLMTAEKKLAEILPEKLPIFITNSVLVTKIKGLKVQFTSFLADLMLSNDPKNLFWEYTNQTPLDSFIDWFLKWGCDLIEEVCPLDLSMTPDCSSLDTYAIVQSTHKRKVVDAPTGQYIQMQDDGYDVSSILNHRPFSTVELGNNEPIVKYSTTIEQQQQQAKTSNLSANNWKPTLHITIPDYLSVAEEATTLGSNHNYNHTPVTINSESTRSSCYKSLTLDEINTYESETDDDNGNESFVENLHTPIPWLGSISKIIWEFFEAGQPSVLGKDYE